MKFIITLLLCWFSAIVSAEESQLIKIVVPFAPGGATDTMAKMLQKNLPKYSKYRFVTEYQVGNSGMIATAALAADRNNRPTLMVISSALPSMIASNSAKVNIDRDLTLVEHLGSLHGVFVTSPRSGLTTVHDLVKANPDFYSIGGAAGWMIAEIFKHQTGVTSEALFSKGESQAFVDVLNNTVTWTVVGANRAVPYINSDRANLVAVTGTRRLPELPQVPTLAEKGINGLEQSPWYLLLVANPGADPLVIRELQQAVKMTFAKDREDYVYLGVDVSNRPANLSNFLNHEIAKMRMIYSRIKAKSTQ